jgi:predicted ATP-grasp superfamily ATP-dependent carboligase
VPGARAILDLADRAMPRSGCGAVILGGAHGSLSMARSLGRRGIPVWFIADEPLITRFSRYVTRTIAWDGADHPDAAGHLLELGHRHKLNGWVLLAGGDPEVRLIAQNHGALASLFRLTTPPWEQVQWAFDKHRTYERAAALGIDCPQSFYPRGTADVARIDARFPLILKPTVRNSRNAFTIEKAWRVDDRAALIARYEQALAMVGEDAIVVQELIPGRGAAQFSYAAVWDNGAPVASLVATRARQYPIDFGYTSTYVRSIEHPAIEAAACRFLASIDYDGLGEVEFKYDARDGRYKLLDVNARSWTWNGLGAAAGVDFADLLWRIKMGETVPPARGRAGAAWINLSRDFVAAVQEMWAGTLSISDYVKSLHSPLVLAASATDDIVPGIVDLPLVGWRTLTRRLPLMADGLGSKRD